MSFALIRGETTAMESFGVVVDKLDTILQDPCFWGQAHMIGDLPVLASLDTGMSQIEIAMVLDIALGTH